MTRGGNATTRPGWARWAAISCPIGPRRARNWRLPCGALAGAWADGKAPAPLEAMAGDAAPNPERIEHDVGGLLCPVGEPEACAAALRTLGADRERVRRMGQHNRQVVTARYTLERMVAGYRAVFERVLGRPVPLRARSSFRHSSPGLRGCGWCM